MKKLCLFLFSISLFTFHFSLSQRYTFRNYNVTDGLAAGSINHIFQDSKGYIWFATQGGGVNKFNGKDFTTYNKKSGLISNDVTYVTEDKTGNMWIATAEGASQFNGTTFTNYTTTNGLTNGVVYCIYVTENKIFFATQDNGVKVFDGTKFDSLTAKDELPSSEAYTIAADKTGNVWFGFYNGIVKYSAGKTTAYNNKLFSDKTFFSSLADSRGNIWFGSTTGDVIIIHTNDSIGKFQLPAENKNDFIGSITEDHQHNIWFATDHGLLKYDGKNFKLFGEREGLSVNTVQTVMCDYENNIWAGTLNGGANLLRNEAFFRFSEKEGLTANNITAICKDKNNKLIIGTGNGIFISSGNTFKKVLLSQIEHANISSLAFDSKYNLWLTTQEGVFVLKETNGNFSLAKKITEINGVRIISPQKVIHDNRGNTWLATYGSGIFLISNKRSEVFNTTSKFISDKILTAFEDSKQNIWFGTQDAGVIKYEDGKFSAPLLPTDAVWSIAEDEEGTLYFGTGESGLCIYKNGKQKFITAKDGLSANYIPALLFDKTENCLWLAGEHGLDKLKWNNNNAQIHNYKEEEGFSAAAVNQNSLLIDNKKLLWLGTSNGLWQFNRQYDLPHSTPPKIQLAGVRLFFGKEDLTKYFTKSDSTTHLPVNLHLPYNKNHLTFNIRALTVSDVLYIVKLEGQDEDWSTPVSNNEITYSNITAGKTYTFNAKAINSAGIESNEMVSFTFTVKAPWWKTWWFIATAVLFIILSLYAFIITRERMLRERNIKLEETVKLRTQTIEHQKQIVEKTLGEKEVLLKEIHHRVKNNLQTISSMLMLQSMELIDESAKKAITESQSRVRSIALVHQKLYQTDGLEKVELSGFVKDLTEQIKSLYQTQSQSISIQLNITETFVLIDKAIPLGLILNELLTNSFKYAFLKTGKGEIIIQSEIVFSQHQSRQVKLTYSDSGEGFNFNETSETSSSLGVELIKLLSEQIGATYTYSNTGRSEFVFIFGMNL